MRIYPKPLEIGPSEGFDPAKDVFNTAEIGQSLTNLISAVTDPLVIAVDGQWGVGKTTFLKMWAGELRKLGYPVIYFDAFENDYSEDAFATIAGEVIGLAKQSKASTTKLLANAKKAGRVLLRSGMKLGVRAATLGALTAADVEAAASEIASEASAITDKYLGEMLTKQQQSKDTLAAFRESLSELPALMTAGSEVSAQLKPLIFIIDELDRCRPAFALEILERVKHLFSVPNVHFVLGAHLRQLESSLGVVYGASLNAHAYLQKFIHVTTMLAPNIDSKGDEEIRAFLLRTAQALELFERHGRTAELCLDFIRATSRQRDLSLRSLERILGVLALALASSSPNTLLMPPILAGLCVLKVEHPELFMKAKLGRLSYREVKDKLPITAVREDGTETFDTMFWRFCADPNVREEYVDKFSRDLASFNLTRSAVVPFTANSVIDRFARL